VRNIRQSVSKVRSGFNELPDPVPTQVAAQYQPLHRGGGNSCATVHDPVLDFGQTPNEIQLREKLDPGEGVIKLLLHGNPLIIL
jgi:hypothetical protein